MKKLLSETTAIVGVSRLAAAAKAKPEEIRAGGFVDFPRESLDATKITYVTPRCAGFQFDVPLKTKVGE